MPVSLGNIILFKLQITLLLRDAFATRLPAAIQLIHSPNHR